RTREIGIIKSFGGSRSEVVEIFITEAVIISILGGILGCIFSVITVVSISPLLTPIMGIPLPYSFPFYLFVIAMVMATLIGFGAALYPSLQAASVRPVEALRYE
ncbi:MAG: ABC transporter permease, partial [Candidatus Helarchaeales archaeon]